MPDDRATWIRQSFQFALIAAGFHFLQFAAAGGVATEKAAETLVAVMTAYKFTSRDFSVIGDLIAKTAADTK